MKFVCSTKERKGKPASLGRLCQYTPPSESWCLRARIITTAPIDLIAAKRSRYSDGKVGVIFANCLGEVVTKHWSTIISPSSKVSLNPPSDLRSILPIDVRIRISTPSARTRSAKLSMNAWKPPSKVPNRGVRALKRAHIQAILTSR